MKESTIFVYSEGLTLLSPDNICRRYAFLNWLLVFLGVVWFYFQNLKNVMSFSNCCPFFLWQKIQHFVIILPVFARLCFSVATFMIFSLPTNAFYIISTLCLYKALLFARPPNNELFDNLQIFFLLQTQCLCPTHFHKLMFL